MSLSMYNRPLAKSQDAQASFPLTAEQHIARDTFAKSVGESLNTHIEALGGFITPGNNAEKNTLMVALSIPMPGITFTNPDGVVETTRGYTLNVNAVIPAPKAQKEEHTAVVLPALSYSEYRAKQLASKAARK